MKIKKNTWRYHYFIHVYQHSSWYDLQFLTYRVWQTEICNYGSFFALPPKNQKNLNFEKIYKITGDIIILHKCTKNHNNMKYSSWDTEWDRHLDYFLPLYPSNNPKNPDFEKNGTNTWRYRVTQVYQKSWSYVILFLRYGA